jgi:hypothetical protein
MKPALLSFVVLTLALPLDAAAQHITLKTVPIPLGEQFQLLPSRNLGMGSVHIAIDDPLLDPFSNPALGVHADRLLVHALPTVYGESRNTLGGRSFPIAAVVPGRRLFGSVAFAMQQVDNPNRIGWTPVPMPDNRVIREASSSNVYMHGTLGTRLGRSTAVGASFFHADLDAVDAVNLLYGNSIAIDQDGSVAEARVGVTHDLGGDRRFDAVVLRSSVDMTHDVLYVDWTWGPQGPTDVRSWTELNEDRTITWGAQLRYRQPLDADGTQIGFRVAGNTKSHPKIPNYNLVNIPRDPGNSTVFNLGVGLASVQVGSVFSLELGFEPGRSHTWAFADTIIETPAGTLQPGDKTVDNQFRYGNWNLAVGVEREGPRAGFQLGLRMHQTRYSLDQHNFLTDVRRKTDERWIEWSPSWGGVLKFDEFDLRYTGRFTAKGWPDMMIGFGARADALVGSPDFVIGPTGVVNLPDFRVTMHRLMVSVPFGR